MSDNFREPEDLLADEAFLSWYYKTGDGNGLHWEAWMTGHPDRDALVREAVKILEAARLPEKRVSEEQTRAAEARLFQAIDVLTAMPEGSGGDRSSGVVRIAGDPGTVRTGSRRLRWMAAAAILLIVVTGWLFMRSAGSGRPAINMSYGRIGSRQLPDGTEVTMNANSTLQYSAGWKEGVDREVWVTGEAFFHVKKTPERSRFIVHSDHFDVIVTGTQFNVVNRHGKDNVLLKEGSVILRTLDGRQLTMQPGDLVAYDVHLLEKKNSRIDSVLAWKEQRLVLDHTPLTDLVTMISDHYGVTVKLDGDLLNEKRISGILPNDKLEILLQALEATGEYDIIRSTAGDSITIRAHSPQN